MRHATGAGSGVVPHAQSGTGGATTGGDPVAWADSIRQVVGFFGQHLR
jgi:hypothetical protein